MIPLLEQIVRTELTGELVLRSVVTGAAYLAGSTLLGLLCYRRKDVA